MLFQFLLTASKYHPKKNKKQQLKSVLIFVPFTIPVGLATHLIQPTNTNFWLVGMVQPWDVGFVRNQDILMRNPQHVYGPVILIMILMHETKFQLFCIVYITLCYQIQHNHFPRLIIQQSRVLSILPYLKSAWDLVYPEQNRDVREILRNLIGCLEDMGTRKQ